MSTAVEASLESITKSLRSNKLFRVVMKFEGTDLHLKVGFAPRCGWPASCGRCSGRRSARDDDGAADLSAAHARGSGESSTRKGGVDFAISSSTASWDGSASTCSSRGAAWAWSPGG